jgi:leucyl aminopeptidase
MADPSISNVRTTPADLATPLLVLQVFERDREPIGVTADIDRVVGGAVRRVLASGDFSGRKDESLLLYPAVESSGIERILLVGAGKREDFTAERLRRAVGTAVRQAERLRVSEIGFALGHTSQLSEHIGAFLAARTTAEAVILAAWDYRELKTQPEEEGRRGEVTSATLFAFDEDTHREYQRAVSQGVAYGRAANFARGLAARPGNVATPSYLADAARGIAEEFGMQITVLDRAGIAEQGLKALLAVAQGTAEEPRFIVLEYRNGEANDKPLVLVGKGVTFDSGGISIKPADRMEEMKYDMSGAAAVLGAMQGIAELGLAANVVAIVPSTENLPSSTALKPGDVIGSLLGKTIEIVNTDAEGRLILADALAYAQRYEPAAVIDAATLTGAVVIALGHHAIGIMGNDGDLMDEVRAAGLRIGERCWPLPLWDEYRPQIDSNFADVKNSGGRPAGTITAGWFLKEFAGTTPWVHLDIAGTAYRDEAAPYLRKGATGVPTRLFIEWVRSRVEG